MILRVAGRLCMYIWHSADDGSKLHFDASEHKALDMIIQVNQKSKSIS